MRMNDTDEYTELENSLEDLGTFYAAILAELETLPLQQKAAS